MTFAQLSFVVVAAAAALTWLSSVHAQQPQAQRPAAVPRPNLTGRWRFSSFGSFWTVDLKLDPSKTTDDEKVYCGEAARDRVVPDTPVIKARLCAEVDPDDGQLHVEVSGAACKANWRSAGMLDGTGSRGGMAMTMGPGRSDDAPGDSMEAPMGGFTAVRLAGATKK